MLTARQLFLLIVGTVVAIWLFGFGGPTGPDDMPLFLTRADTVRGSKDGSAFIDITQLLQEEIGRMDTATQVCASLKKLDFQCVVAPAGQRHAIPGMDFSGEFVSATRVRKKNRILDIWRLRDDIYTGRQKGGDWRAMHRTISLTP